MLQLCGNSDGPTGNFRINSGIFSNIYLGNTEVISSLLLRQVGYSVTPIRECDQFIEATNLDYTGILLRSYVSFSNRPQC